ncbi:MAG: hypothetical protein OEY94_04075 [Alphaproteobacteria bacterium]|nr:hypothetical protein [Alphaproteobacteria bacterium]
MDVGGISRIFSVFRRNKPLVLKPAKSTETDVDSGDPSREKEGYSGRKRAQASVGENLGLYGANGKPVNGGGQSQDPGL